MDNQQASHDNMFSIPGYDKYFVDKVGEIWSSARGTELKKLTPHVHYGRSKSPYLRVRMKGSLQLVHRVVCSAFHKVNLKDMKSVNHINGNTLDNSFENVEVSDHTAQVEHAVKHKLYCHGKKWYDARGLIWEE